MERANFLFSGFFSSPSQSISKVDASYLETKEGKEAYLRFLEANPTIASIHKIYGMQWNSSNLLDERSLHKHCKSLYLRLHPDKVPKDQQELCGKLFSMVQEAEAQVKQELRPSMNFAFSLFGHASSYECLLKMCKQGKWAVALNQLITCTMSIKAENEEFCLLACAIYLRSGQLQLAIECFELLPAYLQGLGHLGKRLINWPEQASSPQSQVDELQKWLSDLRAYKNLIKRDADTLVELIIPHFVFMRLKAIYREMQDEIGYEVALREAVRRCPSSNETEKKNLIIELQNYIADKYPCNFSTLITADCVLEQLQELYSLMLKAFYEEGLEDLAKEIDLIFGDQNSLLLQIQKTLQVIEKKLNPALRPWKLIFELLWEAGNSPNEDLLVYWKTIFLGLEFYLKEDKRKAAHYFYLAKEDLCLGLVQFDLHEHNEAFQSLSKISRPSAKKYMLQLMNYCDTLFVAEASSFSPPVLGSVDQIQTALLSNRYL